MCLPWIRQASLDDMDSLDDLPFLRNRTLETEGVEDACFFKRFLAKVMIQTWHIMTDARQTTRARVCPWPAVSFICRDVFPFDAPLPRTSNVTPSQALFDQMQVLRAAGCDYLPAFLSSSWTHVDDMVSIADHLGVMFDHDKRRPLFNQALEHR